MNQPKDQPHNFNSNGVCSDCGVSVTKARQTGFPIFCVTSSQDTPNDQPVDELFRILDEYYELKRPDELGVEPENKIIALIQAECNRARLLELEQLPPHTTKLGYSYLVDRMAELQQLMKEE